MFSWTMEALIFEHMTIRLRTAITLQGKICKHRNWNNALKVY